MPFAPPVNVKEVPSHTGPLLVAVAAGSGLTVTTMAAHEEVAHELAQFA
jgi:hypothetical protein